MSCTDWALCNPLARNLKITIEKKTKYITRPKVINKIHISKLVMFRRKYLYTYIKIYIYIYLYAYKGNLPL